MYNNIVYVIVVYVNQNKIFFWHLIGCNYSSIRGMLEINKNLFSFLGLLYRMISVTLSELCIKDRS